MADEETFGGWLKRQRKALDLTQDELALRVGCSPVLIRKIEADDRRPSRQVAEILAEQLQIPLEERPDFVRFARAKNALVAPGSSPWRTLRHHLTNLPIPPSPLIGRQRELEAIVTQLTAEKTRLLTLVGPPGIGKTRLALACAEQLLDHFEDGVFFISLAPIRDPDLVPDAIALSLKMNLPGEKPAAEHVKTWLADKRLLLLLDNLEQVVDSAPWLADLVLACPWLQIIVTSRVSLHLRAERQFPVHGLPFPLLDSPPDLKRIRDHSSVELFLDRAQSIDPDFSLTEENATSIAEICARVEGLPLAIELVAARVGQLPLSELQANLSKRLDLLTEGPRDLPARHQSLRDAIRWSCDLLAPRARSLFAQLGVFVGGWSEPAALAVCQVDDGVNTRQRLGDLVDANLIVAELRDNPARYSMLETIREYAQEQLESGGEAARVRRRFADYFLKLAEDSEPELTGRQQMQWLNQLEREHHNLRAALRWIIERCDSVTALRLCGALGRFWQTRGHLREGLEWGRQALNLTPVSSDPAYARARAKTLASAGWLLRDFGDFATAKSYFEEAVALCTRLGDRNRLAYALYSAGYINYLIGDQERGIQTIEESVALYRDLQDQNGIALPLFMLGRICIGKGEYDRADAYLRESLEVETERGATFGKARTLGSLGELTIYMGEYARSATYLEESQAILEQLGERQLLCWVLTKRGELAWGLNDLAQADTFLETSLQVSREIGYRWNTAYNLCYGGMVALSRGELEHARNLCESSLAIFRELGSEVDIAQTTKDLARVVLCQGHAAQAATMYSDSLRPLAGRNFLPDVAECLEGLATVRGQMGQPRAAARLFGAAQALRERLRSPLFPVRQPLYEQAVASVRAQLDEKTMAQMWAEGCTAPLERIVEFAMEHSD